MRTRDFKLYDLIGLKYINPDYYTDNENDELTVSGAPFPYLS